MKNKGFTLMELLAVIVILAIIALIAVPVVLNLINNSKIQSKKRSIELYKSAVDHAISNYTMMHDGEFPTDISQLDIQYNGTPVICDITLIDGKAIYNGECQVGYEEPSQPVVNYPTYEVGQEIKLNGKTAIVDTDTGTVVVEGLPPVRILNYTRWYVLKQTDTTVTLLSHDVIPINPYSNEHFVWDPSSSCTACTWFSWDSLNVSYSYEGVSARVPTMDDLSEVTAPNSGSDIYTNDVLYTGMEIGSIIQWMSVSSESGMVIQVNDGGVNKVLVARSDGTGHIYTYGDIETILNNVGQDYVNIVLFNRVAITLPKSKIPNQN